jgi:hypothetical protein
MAVDVVGVAVAVCVGAAVVGTTVVVDASPCDGFSVDVATVATGVRAAHAVADTKITASVLTKKHHLASLSIFDASAIGRLYLHNPPHDYQTGEVAERPSHHLL